MLKCNDSCTCPSGPACLGRLFPDLFGTQYRAHWESGCSVRREHIRHRSQQGYQPFDPGTPSPSTVVSPQQVSEIKESPESPSSGPSLIQKAANFGRALITHVVAGLPQADHATVQSRLDLCHECSYYDADTKTCLHKSCGCNMEIKVTWTDQKCPIGKW